MQRGGVSSPQPIALNVQKSDRNNCMGKIAIRPQPHQQVDRRTVDGSPSKAGHYKKSSTLTISSIAPMPSLPTWTDDTELVGLRFELQPHYSSTLFPQYSIGLHAWFLDCVRQSNPELSTYLHDGESEKPFSLSLLDGELPLVGRQLQVSGDRTYGWTLNLLTAELVKWAKTWLETPPQTLNLRAATFDIKAIEVDPPPTTYQTLFDTADAASVRLSFLSPTSFRHRGHHVPLPVPTNLFHSYLRRWNDFSGLPVETEDFLDWVDSHVVLRRHDIRSHKVAAGKRGAVTGFTGSIELSVSATARRQNPDYAKLFAALARFAPYCGTGHKTPFGLGRTCVGWTEATAEPNSEQARLAERIDDLNELLLTRQKRPESDRARKICQTRATILARRELGESLQAIADDLEMPYDTVKTYVKLTRRTLRDLESNPQQQLSID
ncbi:CRISPR-associated endoribonuclease Cas6 [Baaleninema simplex]|uniref:CRISPR-associated endoribonuclease Cas6 n=1 Tax=Baaleninema simplex TaxID=2862350 RepID=UPI00034D22C3